MVILSPERAGQSGRGHDLRHDKPTPAASEAAAGDVEIEYFTDPLCCWSWAFEPQWRRLLESHAVTHRYRMGGMLASWNLYRDPAHSIDGPAQMGPLWFQVRHMFQVPLDDQIWLSDPPGSSYPACAAVKAAGLQSAAAEEIYLRRLREAVMTRCQNIARQGVLEQIAWETAAEYPGHFDAERFAADLFSEPSLQRFREDIERTSCFGIDRFPTLVVRRQGQQRAIQLVGCRRYETLVAVLAEATAEPAANR